jgi:UDP-N-acetylmuramyl pentapeptide phosphotransferase/UDP-N-acetylglucosamine-1-phosphate transferase
MVWFQKCSLLIRNLLANAFIFIATGLNPSIFLAISYILFASWIYQKRFEKKDWIIAITALASFGAWAGISRMYGGIPYGKYDFAQLLEGINIVAGFNGLSNMIGIIALLALGYISLKFKKPIIFYNRCIHGVFSLLSYSRGLIFIGDDGACLTGFRTATLSASPVNQHTEIHRAFP